MFRAVVVVAVFMVLTVSARGQATESAKVQITTVAVTPSIHIIEAKSEDADIAVFEGEDGLIVVDTGLAPLAPKLRDSIRSLSPKPLKYVLLTHYHFDHIGGAELFAGEARVIAQENTRRRMTQPSHVAGRNDPPAPTAALPVLTFDKQLSLFLGNEEVRLLSFAAHTDGDAVVWFKRANVVHMGDSILGADNEGGGDIYGTIEACERVASMVPADAKIIVGHIGVISVDDLRKQGSQWRDATTIVETALKQGKSLEQIKKEKLLATVIKGNPDRVAEMLYGNLKARTRR